MDRERNRQIDTGEGGDREGDRNGKEGNGGQRTFHALRNVVRWLAGMTEQITHRFWLVYHPTPNTVLPSLGLSVVSTVSGRVLQCPFSFCSWRQWALREVTHQMNVNSYKILTFNWEALKASDEATKETTALGWSYRASPISRGRHNFRSINFWLDLILTSLKNLNSTKCPFTNPIPRRHRTVTCYIVLSP